MPNTSRLPLHLLSITLLLPACAEQETTDGPTVTTDDRGAVIVEQGGYLAISQKVPGGLVTEVRDAQTHEDLALFEWEQASNTAVLEIWDNQQSQEVDIDAEGGPPTLDTVHAYALASYERSQEEFRKVYFGIGICCHMSYGWDCGWAWEDEDAEIICCEWCTIYD